MNTIVFLVAVLVLLSMDNIDGSDICKSCQLQCGKSLGGSKNVKQHKCCYKRNNKKMCLCQSSNGAKYQVKFCTRLKRVYSISLRTGLYEMSVHKNALGWSLIQLPSKLLPLPSILRGTDAKCFRSSSRNQQEAGTQRLNLRKLDRGPVKDSTCLTHVTIFSLIKN